MPSHLTSFRGRGGFGKSQQSLSQHFFKLSPNSTESTWAIQTLIHTYIGIISSSNPAKGNFNIGISFPLWTDNWDAELAPMGGKNDGTLFLNAMKIVISGEPKDSYVGFYTPRGKPFMKSSGKNEIVALS